jgi:hypothetical protein
MFSKLTFLVAAVAYLVNAAPFESFNTSIAARTLDKPLLSPPIPPLDAGILAHVKKNPGTWDKWGAGWMPSTCQEMTVKEKYDPYDIEVFNVHYADVGPPVPVDISTQRTRANIFQRSALVPGPFAATSTRLCPYRLLSTYLAESPCRSDRNRQH